MRRRDQRLLEMFVEAQTKAVQGALAAVEETVARVVETVLGPARGEDQEFVGLEEVAQRVAPLSSTDGQRPEWGAMDFEYEEDPDPTDLDKPFDTWEGRFAAVTDRLVNSLTPDLRSPSTNGRASGAFLRPGESPIPQPNVEG